MLFKNSNDNNKYFGHFLHNKSHVYALYGYTLRVIIAEVLKCLLKALARERRCLFCDKKPRGRPRGTGEGEKEGAELGKGEKEAPNSAEGGKEGTELGEGRGLFDVDA